jgi:hypothetical protein
MLVYAAIYILMASFFPQKWLGISQLYKVLSSKAPLLVERGWGEVKAIK